MTLKKVGQIAIAVVFAAGLAGTAGAQEIAAAPADDPLLSLSSDHAPELGFLLGDWTAIDPATGMREIVSLTPDSLTFGAAPPLPFRVERDGDSLVLWVAEAEAPLLFHFFDATNAQLSVPEGPTIALRREPPPGTPVTPVEVKIPEPDAIADAAASLLPPKPPFP